MSAIRVLIAETYRLVAAALKTVIEAGGECAVVGEPVDRPSLDLAIRKLDPHVLVLDHRLPGVDVLELVRFVSAKPRGPRVLLLSDVACRTHAAAALSAGAAGYVLRSCSPAELVRSIRIVASGGTAVDAAVSARRSADAGPFDRLSPRERQVCNALLRGLTNAEVSRRLGLSIKTAETFRQRVFAKMHVDSRATLFELAISHGLVSIEDEPQAAGPKPRASRGLRETAR